jgi:hypothetical protein
MSTKRVRYSSGLAIVAAIGCGLGPVALIGCNAPRDESQGQSEQQATVAEPSSKAAPARAPSERLSQYKAHSPPVLAAAAHVAGFLDWVGASHGDEKDDARKAIQAAAGNKDVVQGLIAEVERVRASDHSRAMLALAVLGETRSPTAQAFFSEFARRPLPQAGTVIEGEIIEQTQAAQLQGKAVDGLAYINNDSANKVVMDVIANHPSRIVRAEAINAYLWNHGDSDDARSALSQVVRTDESILLDRVRRVPGETASTFNAKLEQYLKRHPEVIPPAPVQLPTAAKPATQSQRLDEEPPAF